MSKLNTMLQYKMQVQWSMAIWYLVIYPLAMVVVSFALIKTGIISEQSGGLMYRIWGSVLFLFAISIRFREDFDFLLTLSNTRHDIFLTQIIPAVIFSVLFSGLIVVEKLIVDHLNNILRFPGASDKIHLFAPYASGNLLTLFLYFLMLCFCCSAAGVLLGSLFYRFGQKFVLVFWLVFSAIPTLILPVSLWSLHQRGILTDSMTDLGAYLTNFNVLGASVILMVMGLGFGAATYLNIRRLPQK